MSTTSTSTSMDSPPAQPPSSSETVVSTTLPSSSSEGMEEEAQIQSSMVSPPNPNSSIVEPPPPPPFIDSKEKNLKSSQNADDDNNSNHNHISKEKASVPYSIPPWSEPPSLPFLLEVIKDGAIIDHLDVTKKGAYMFGRIDMCDFVLEHPTISRFHAVLQFKGSEAAYMYDLGSTHGTFINKKQVNKKEYVDLRVGDVIRFGLSSRLYIFQGPEELMPLEADMANIRYSKDREASLRRAKENAALADGISWGMGEDAFEEAEDDSDEVTWQNYKGELTEKQQKTREKVLKRMEKIAHMKKEMAAIRAKDISQGGLTQGQQTQIARNEMRIAQILEELESLEETLNDSIRESLGARTGKSSRGKQKGLAEDEDEYNSDDDEFYDRTKKRNANKLADTQSVETADSLLDKKEALLNEMEERKRLFLEEKNKNWNLWLWKILEMRLIPTCLVSHLNLALHSVLDRTAQLENDLSSLQTKLDRVIYLLKIADPTGETAMKRATAPKDSKSKESVYSSSAVKKPEKSKIEQKIGSQPEMSVSGSVAKQVTPNVNEELSQALKSGGDVTESTESKPTSYKIAKPQWLGAVENSEKKESQSEKQSGTDEGDDFIDYKERNKILESTNCQTEKKPESDLESAAPGLILRKRKPAETVEDGQDQREEEADLTSHEPRNQKQSGKIRKGLEETIRTAPKRNSDSIIRGLNIPTLPPLSYGLAYDEVLPFLRPAP
ncbi:Kanadaptin [Bienertia sinuspersici]